MINDPLLLTIIGLGFDILGALFISLLKLMGGSSRSSKYELFKKLAQNKKLFKAGKDPVTLLDNYLTSLGFAFLMLGFLLQLIGNSAF